MLTIIVLQVEGSPAFKKLAKIYAKTDRLYLWDFDGYDHVSMGRTLQQVIDDPNKKMGHGFVLLMLLRGERLWENCDIPEYVACSQEVLPSLQLTYLHNSLQYDPKAKAEEKKPEPRGPLISAGFIIKSAGLYLVCHATNRRPPSSTDGSWTISKVANIISTRMKIPFLMLLRRASLIRERRLFKRRFEN